MSRDAGPSQPRRAAASAFVGSAVEYYDFTLFATASALFLGPVFFAPLGPTGSPPSASPSSPDPPAPCCSATWATDGAVGTRSSGRWC